MYLPTTCRGVSETGYTCLKANSKSLIDWNCDSSLTLTSKWTKMSLKSCWGGNFICSGRLASGGCRPRPLLVFFSVLYVLWFVPDFDLKNTDMSPKSFCGDDFICWGCLASGGCRPQTPICCSIPCDISRGLRLKYLLNLKNCYC